MLISEKAKVSVDTDPKLEALGGSEPQAQGTLPIYQEVGAAPAN